MAQIAKLVKLSGAYQFSCRRRSRGGSAEAPIPIVAAALKRIYDTDTAEIAAQQLEGFDSGESGRKCPNIAQSWRRNWQHVFPFFDFSQRGPKYHLHDYTTNSIESINSSVRTAGHTRGHFPRDKSAAKLICVALGNIQANWTKPPIASHDAKPQFAIAFEQRFITND